MAKNHIPGHKRNTNVDEDAEKKEPSYTAGGNVR
jgi:hypothetical protein